MPTLTGWQPARTPGRILARNQHVLRASMRSLIRWQPGRPQGAHAFAYWLATSTSFRANMRSLTGWQRAPLVGRRCVRRQTYADVFRRIQTYSDVCRRTIAVNESLHLGGQKISPVILRFSSADRRTKSISWNVEWRVKKCKKMTNMKCYPTLSTHQMLDFLVVFASSEERKSGRLFHSDGRAAVRQAKKAPFYNRPKKDKMTPELPLTCEVR